MICRTCAQCSTWNIILINMYYQYVCTYLDKQLFRKVLLASAASIRISSGDILQPGRRTERSEVWLDERTRSSASVATVSHSTRHSGAEATTVYMRSYRGMPKAMTTSGTTVNFECSATSQEAMGKYFLILGASNWPPTMECVWARRNQRKPSVASVGGGNGRRQPRVAGRRLAACEDDTTI
jgi:hypothetical protein